MPIWAEGITLLQVKNLDVFYGDIQVIRGVSLEVLENEIVGVVGSNSAGKSTVLNTVSGLVVQKRGEIHFQDHLICGFAHHVVELGLVLVPEGRRLFPFMTVLENLEMATYTQRARPRKKELLGRIFQMMPMIEERKKQMAGSLSGGEQQMLAIARGLMSDPKMLMLDEPSMGLAPIMVEKVLGLIQEIKGQGVAVLLVEQNVLACLNIANRAYTLENGQIVMHGSGKELLADPKLKKAYLGI